MRRHKYILVILSVFLLSTKCLHAQEKIRNLNFVYIAHDRTIPSSCLSNEMQLLYDQGKRYPENAFIFYLANEDNPRIVTLNLPNDNSADFEKLIIAELINKVEHDIIVGFDVDSIITMFNHNDFIDNSRKLKYETVTFDFYVGKKFFTNGFHETLISRLYWLLEIDKLKEQELDWRIWGDKALVKHYSKKDKNGDEIGIPLSFGIKNLSDINSTNAYVNEYSCN